MVDIDRDALKSYIAQLKPTFWGRFFYYCIPFRKKIILQNIRRVFAKSLSQQEMEKLAKSFYSHLLTSLKENFAMRFMSLKQIAARASVLGHENVLDVIDHNKGAIILTGHFGNWEFAPIAGILNFKQYKGRLHFIRRTLRVKFLEKILFRQYYKAGLHVIPKKNALFKACEALDQNDAIVFVMDQHASIESKDGISVEFFGEKAGTYRSLAMIARYTNVPVIPATCYRRADGQHVLQFFKALPWVCAEDQEQEIYLNTLAYNQALEKIILERPEQWLWMHRRWKLK